MTAPSRKGDGPPHWPLTVRQRSGVRCALELDCGTPADAAPHGVAAQLTADDAVTLFTAGTTGRAKIVPLTHANVAASLHGIMTTYELGPGEATVVAAVPFPTDTAWSPDCWPRSAPSPVPWSASWTRPSCPPTE
ncbi:AMP-binding protein [Streptomyces sp. NPDC004658]|uniref:AMP-binding protein n=1 Tax=Streptomyces sp. NPDC004658 TaxID=3154672 RepID=UPI0033A0E16E